MPDGLDPRYPIGRYRPEPEVDAERRAEWIAQIAGTPAKLLAALDGLDDAQLDTPYRDGGWTVRQVAHHVPDSHLNAYVRFKLALTEDEPTIKPYDEAGWANLPDSSLPVDPSLRLLDALHERWTVLLHALPDEAWARTFRHPELGRLRLDHVLGLYAWHGRHHVAHVTRLRERMGW